MKWDKKWQCIFLTNEPYLKNNRLFDNYFGKEAQEELNKVELNLENSAIMWEIFEGRLAEFESGILK